MKILQLKFKNINSLTGEHQLNFTDAAFTAEGLFAITGKTGAGKSSILDAIALALYGKTPRVDISASENAVMTRGEKDCYAEVSFETGGTIWKTSWKQERTKSGNLKPVQRVIANQDGEIIADQVRSCAEKIIEIIGLNFEQFTKVILLAQGSFAAFLQADKNDKGALLEQITGTEIYGEISKKVFDRCKLEKEKLDKILVEFDAIQILDDEALQKFTEDKRLLEQEKDLLEAQINTLEVAKKWLEDLANLEKELNQAKQDLPFIATQKEQAQQALNNAKETWLASKNNLEKHESIFKQVRELDTKISFKNKLLLEIKNQLTALNDNKTAQQELFTAYEAEFENKQDSLNTQKKWVHDNVFYQTLPAQMSAIEKDDHLLQEAKLELDSIYKVINGLNQNLVTEKLNEQKLSDDYKKLSNELVEVNLLMEVQKKNIHEALQGKNITDLTNEKEQILQVGQQLKSIIQIVEELNKQHIESNKLKQSLEALEKEKTTLSQSIDNEQQALMSLKSSIGVLEDNIQLNKTIQSLTEHRHQLKDGEACPLCGALEHPYAMGNLPVLSNQEEQLKQLKLALEQKIEALHVDENKLLVLGSNQHHTLENLNKINDSIKKLKVDEVTHLQGLKDLHHHFELPANSDKINTLQLLRNEKLAQFKDLQKIIEQVQSLETALQSLRENKYPEINKKKEDAYKNWLASEKNTTQLSAELNNKLENVKQIEERYSKWNATLTEVYKQYQINSLDELKNCLITWNQKQSAIESLLKDIQELENKIALAKQSIQQAEEDGIKKIEAQLSHQQELNEWLLERSALFGNKVVDEEEKLMKGHLTTSEDLKILAEKKHQELVAHHAKIEAVMLEKEKAKNEKLGQKITAESLLDIETTWLEKKGLKEQILEKIGAYKQIMLTQQEAKKQLGTKQNQKEKQEALYKRWSILSDLIGSADGRKYRNFAQSLTFEQLIKLANRQLQKMSDRYLLLRSEDASNPFELWVVDQYQNNESRTAQNLSGGEKFIISLALALGLSNMAGKNISIDTLFIDEGFGTLDSDYLDVALSALSNLQSEGKMIGVISHLSELKERIATHVEVIPKGNGHSYIQVTTA